MKILCVFSLIVSIALNICATYDVQFILADDPLIKQYVSVLYNGALDTDPIYILTKPSTLFFEGQDGQSTLYFSTGYVGPRFKIAEDQRGTCMTYGTYFLLHELYLEYLLAHPEALVLQKTHTDAEHIEDDLQAGKLVHLSPFLATYLAAICADGEVLVERTTDAYCAYPSTMVKNSNEQGIQYIISPLLGEMLFKHAQKEQISAEPFDDTIYLARLFNDRSHWTALTDEQEAFFNAHKDEPANGGFLCDAQARMIFKEFLKKGIFAGIYHQGCEVYVDLSGFMVGNHRHALLVCNTDAEKPTFIITPFLIHLISMHQAAPFFTTLLPAVADALKTEQVREQL